MPTLLQINVTSNWGSTGKIAEDIGLTAMSRGWRSVIAYGRYENPSKSETIKVGTGFSINEHVLESRLLDNHGLSSRFATRKFIRQIEEIRPDIIHLHNIHGYFVNYKLLFEYLSQTDIPIVWTLHDCWLFTGHCSFFDFYGCELWRTGCHAPCVCKGFYPKSSLADRSEKNWKQKKESFTSVKNMTLVPVSDWLGGLLHQSFMEGYPVQVIHNGIDLDVFRPMEDADDILRRYGLQGKRVVLGVASVWAERKGLPDFVKLRSQLPDGYSVVLVGVDEEQKASLPSDIISIRRTQNQQELAQLYTAADIFVNPTYEDNYPTTNLEAMACGTPVLTYKTGGSPEAVSEETGWVVDKGDVEGMANIIKSMGEKSSTVSAACRSRAEACFERKKCYDNYFNLYDKIISVK